MEARETRLLRRSFVVHPEEPHGALDVQDLASLRRTRLESLEHLPAQLAEWLQSAGDGDSRARSPARLSRSEARVATLALDGLTRAG
jgi:hypothetical protein